MAILSWLPLVSNLKLELKMPRLATTDTKDRYTRQVATVHQSTSGSDLASHHKVYLYALDGSRIGFCDMFNDDDELQYID